MPNTIKADESNVLTKEEVEHLLKQHAPMLLVLSDISHAISKLRGWWQDPKTGDFIERNFGEMVALQHSELSEALEGYRTDAMSDKIPEFTAVEEEMADALFRILDMAGAMNLRLGEAFLRKGLYNLRRVDHSLEARAEANGKKF